MVWTPYGRSDRWMDGRLSQTNIPLYPINPRTSRQLLISKGNDPITRATMAEFPNYVSDKTVIVVNTTPTIPARLFPVDLANVFVDVSQKIGEDFLIRLTPQADPVEFSPGDILRVNGGATIILKEAKVIVSLPIPDFVREILDIPVPPQMWLAEIHLPEGFNGENKYIQYLNQYGSMVTYEIVENRVWNRADYQSVFSDLYGENYPENSIWGAPEAPTASLGFTEEIVDQLINKGVQTIPILLQNGVTFGKPLEEYVHIPSLAARELNDALAQGKQIIAIGTTVARSLFASFSYDANQFLSIQEHTNKIIDVSSQLPYIHGILTTVHEPRESHMDILRALAGDNSMRNAYYYYVRNGIPWDIWGAYHLITR